MSTFIQSKQCHCGEAVPANCVRCRSCGAFLNKDIEQFHAERHDQANQWFVLVKGVQKGPFSTEALREVFSRNDASQAMVWRPGLESWIEAFRVQDFVAGDDPTG